MFRSSTLFLLIFSAAGLCPALSAQEKIGKARAKIKIGWAVDHIPLASLEQPVDIHLAQGW